MIGTLLTNRYRVDAQLGAGLTHPGIVAVHDVVEDGDARHIVMEYSGHS